MRNHPLVLRALIEPKRAVRRFAGRPFVRFDMFRAAFCQPLAHPPGLGRIFDLRVVHDVVI